MGQALDFLHKKATYTRTKSKHNALCKEKIDNFLKENETIKCKEQKAVKVGPSDNLKVNEKFNYQGSLKQISARRFSKKPKQKCEACQSLFTPLKIRRRLTRYEVSIGIGRETIWCEFCRSKGTEYRYFMKKVGGKDEYERLLWELKDDSIIAKSGNFREIYHELDKRLFLKRGTKRLENAIEKLIAKAFKENDTHSARYSHPEFDF